MSRSSLGNVTVPDAVFAINPKQLDRFRDRFTVAGAKDDRRDAHVLGDSLRTDRRAFRLLAVDDPTIIELREWSRHRRRPDPGAHPSGQPDSPTIVARVAMQIDPTPPCAGAAKAMDARCEPSATASWRWPAPCCGAKPFMIPTARPSRPPPDHPLVRPQAAIPSSRPAARQCAARSGSHPEGGAAKRSTAPSAVDRASTALS